MEASQRDDLCHGMNDMVRYELLTASHFSLAQGEGPAASAACRSYSARSNIGNNSTALKVPRSASSSARSTAGTPGI